MLHIFSNKITKTKLFILSLVWLFVLFSTTVWAEEVENYKLLAPLPGMSGDTGVDAGDYLTTLFYVGIGIAGVLAVIMITIGGLQYMTTEAISGKSSAKSRINNAIFGLILALASFVLLETINTDFVNPSLEIEPVEKSTVITLTSPPKEWKGKCVCYNVSVTDPKTELTIRTSTKQECIDTCGKFCSRLRTVYWTYNCILSPVGDSPL